jgi:hypothetical protein
MVLVYTAMVPHVREVKSMSSNNSSRTDFFMSPSPFADLLMTNPVMIRMFGVRRAERLLCAAPDGGIIAHYCPR